MLPHAGKPRQLVFELRQLDLNLRGVGSRARGEYVEDEAAAIDYLNISTESFLDISGLIRLQVIIKNDGINLLFIEDLLDLLELTCADKRCRNTLSTTLIEPRNDLATGRFDEPSQLRHRLLIKRFIDIGRLQAGDNNLLRIFIHRLDFQSIS